MVPEIAFFSSNARHLYTEDIYRALSLPKGYVIQFRYSETLITADIRRDYNSILGKSGVIFFTINNQQTQNPVTNIPIRYIKIVDIEPNKSIDKVSFYLELGDFCECVLDPNLNSDTLGRTIFLSKAVINVGMEINWNKVIEKVNPYIVDVLFFHVEQIKDKNGKEVAIKYNDKERQSSYTLDDEEKYSIEASFYDKDAGINILNVEKNNNLIDFHVSDQISIGTIQDHKNHKIRTRSIDVTELYTFLRFSTSKVNGGNQKYTVELFFNIKKKLRKPILFGLHAVLLAVAALLLKFISSEDLKAFDILLAVLSTVIIGYSAGYLYWSFNKK